MTRRPRLVPILLTLTALLAVRGAAPAQAIPVAHATPGGHSIVVVDEDTGAASVAVAGVSFESLDLVGYPARQRLRLDRPAAVSGADIPAHVRLPQGGSLYRIRLDGQVALLHVAAAGGVTVAFSRPAIVGDPTWMPQVGVSPDGATALLATSPAAGGDVIRLDLATGTHRSLTEALAPLAVAADSLRVAGSHSWFIADDQVYRCDGAAGAAAQVVPSALLAGRTPLPEIAMSRDGRAVAFVIEDDSGRRRLAAVDPAGNAFLVSTTLSDYDTPGYADPTGPFLALSDDGGLVGYRRTVATRELFVRDLAAGSAPQQLTADANFIDTIDNVGVIGFTGLRTLMFAAGEVSAPGGAPAVDSADLYAATVDPGGVVAFQNVTQTSGVATPPFVAPGELELLEVVEDPLGERLLLIVDPSGSGDAALHSVPFDGSAGPTALLPALDALPTLLPLGDRVLVLAPLGAGLPPLAPTDVHMLHPSAAPGGLAFLGTAPAGVTIDRPSGSAAHGVGAFVVSAGADLELAFHVDLATSAVSPVWFDLLGVAPATAISPGGRVVVGLGFSGGPFLFARFDAPMVGEILDVPIAAGFPLTR